LPPATLSTEGVMLCEKQEIEMNKTMITAILFFIQNIGY